MALQNSFDSRYGLNLPVAYHQVVGIGYDSPSNSMNITVGIYVSLEARDKGSPPIDVVSFNTDKFDKSAPYSAFRLIYGYLKTLPEYADAIDV